MPQYDLFGIQSRVQLQTSRWRLYGGHLLGQPHVKQFSLKPMLEQIEIAHNHGAIHVVRQSKY